MIALISLQVRGQQQPDLETRDQKTQSDGIKEELSHLDVDAAIDLADNMAGGEGQIGKSLEQEAGEFVAGMDVADESPSSTSMDPILRNARLADDANAIIRMSHAGWVDQEYFESYVASERETQVKFGQIWFMYLFHSRCKSKSCILLNEAYEYMFIDWLNQTRTVGIDLEKEDTPEIKFARDNVKIGRVNCKKFKREICDRIMMRDQQLPKFLILHNTTSYEYRGNLTWEFLLD